MSDPRRAPEYGKQVSDHQLDLSLLLYVCGATAREAGEAIGLTEYQWRRRVVKLGQAWLDARRAASAPPHGTESRYGRGCRCGDCRAATSEAHRRREGSTQIKSGAVSRRQIDDWRREVEYRESIEAATRYKQPWTGPELELAARDDLSIAEIAGMLHRTTHAVVNMRKKLRHEPKFTNLSGL